jgi:preprotein translocase subunit YajC
MKATARFLSVSVFGLLMLGMEAQARPRAFQDPPPAQNPTPAQTAGAPQTPGRGGERRPGVLGKLTAIHDQSIEIAEQTGSTVTVKITATTQFRKDREAAKLSDFKVGDLVFVRGEENADHTWTAEMIRTRAGGGFGGRGQGGGGPEGGRAGGQGGRAGVIAQTGVLGQDYVFGEVKSIDAPKLTILRSDNVTQTIELNEETSLHKGRDSITMADIQAGDHVLVHGGMKDNAFQPKAVMVIGPEQWKRMQEMGMAGGPPANPPKDNNLQQKPPEPPH